MMMLVVFFCLNNDLVIVFVQFFQFGHTFNFFLIWS